MKDRLKIAFIFHKENRFLSGTHFDNTYYHFFIDALKRSEKMKVEFFTTGDYFDIKKIGENFDGVLLWENNVGTFGNAMPNEIENIKKTSLPVIAKSSDPNMAKKSLEYHEKWKIDYYFHFYHESLFYDLYPKKFPFKTKNPACSVKLFSKFLISFFINSRVKTPVTSTPKEFINVPMPGIINY